MPTSFSIPLDSPRSSVTYFLPSTLARNFDYNSSSNDSTDQRRWQRNRSAEERVEGGVFRRRDETMGRKTCTRWDIIQKEREKQEGIAARVSRGCCNCWLPN